MAETAQRHRRHLARNDVRCPRTEQPTFAHSTTAEVIAALPNDISFEGESSMKTSIKTLAAVEPNSDVINHDRRKLLAGAAMGFRSRCCRTIPRAFGAGSQE